MPTDVSTASIGDKNVFARRFFYQPALIVFSHHPICFSLATLLTLSGVWVEWRWQEYCMSTEEAIKSRALTQDQGERRLRRIKRGGRFFLLLGMGLLIGGGAFFGE